MKIDLQSVTIKNYQVDLGKLYEMLLFIITLIVYVPLVHAQHAPIEDVDILKKHKQVLINEYPHVFERLTIDNVLQISNKFSKIVYHKDGIYHEAIVEDKKELVLVAEYKEIPYAELPGTVKDAFRGGLYKDWQIVKTFKARTPYEEWSYAIEVYDETLVKRLHYTALGIPVEPFY